MKKYAICVSLFLFVILIVFSISIKSFSAEVSVQEYLKGKLPAIFNIYLASLEDLDEQEVEFIDLLANLPVEEQRTFAREVYEEGFSPELLERLRDLQGKLEKPYLKVAFPGTDRQKISGNPIFVFGCTLPSQNTKVTVNGEEVERYDELTGNFLTLVEIPEKTEFPIKVTATLGEEETSLERTVVYEPTWQEMPEEPLAIHSANVQPREDQILGEGELLRVIVQGSPGAEAAFKIGNSGAEVAMEELSILPASLNGRGIYLGSYPVKESDISIKGKEEWQFITVLLRRGGKEISRRLPGKVSLTTGDTPHIFKTINERTRFYRINRESFNLQGVTLGGDGWLTQVVGYDLLPETYFKVTGKAGEYFRIRLGANDYLIHQSDMAEYQDEGGELNSTLSGITIKQKEGKSEVRLNFSNSRHIPFLIEDKSEQLSITFYGIGRSENFSITGSSSSVKTIELVPQVTGLSAIESAAVLNIKLYHPLVGYDYFWDKSELVISLRKPPAISPDNPLQNRIIVLDPGHGGDAVGAIGPGDVPEKVVVLEISRYLKQLLVEKGARVIMTRSGDRNLSIRERIEKAVEEEADLFISIHANAHAQGADAVSYHGHMTLYNYNYNKQLAEIILNNLAKKTGLPKTRVWKRPDIGVLRRPQVPSVLVETAYLMHPKDNRYLLLPEYQHELALSIRDGISDYFLNINSSN